MTKEDMTAYQIGVGKEKGEKGKVFVTTSLLIHPAYRKLGVRVEFMGINHILSIGCNFNPPAFRIVVLGCSLWFGWIVQEAKWEETTQEVNTGSTNFKPPKEVQ
jgi:hypothetical protein